MRARSFAPDHRQGRRPGRSTRTGVAATAALAVAASLLAASVGTASAAPRTPSVRAPATPSDNARERAHQLREQLAKLQTEAEAATEDYDAAQAQLGQVVAGHLLAEQQLENARNMQDGENLQQVATIRSLYRTGGISALYATVFTGSDPSDALARLRSVEHVVSTQDNVARSAAGVVADAASIEAHLASLARQQTALSARASDAIGRVQQLLGRQQQLVAQADAEVVRLEQAEAAQVAAAAAARAAQSLAQARAMAFPGGTGDVAAPNTAVVDAALGAARAQLGKPYRWGATGPGSFDCSGLTGWAYSVAGVLLPRTSREQWFAGPHPGLGYLQPGDLLFWATNPTDPSTIHHVALYIGDGQMIAAPHTGAVVSVQPVYLDGYIGAVRPTAAG